MQDLSQLVKIYGQEFVDFVTANTGSLFVLGIQDGFSANKFSELLGEKTIAKLHRSVSHSEGGKSTSIDEQHHQEKVMGANEFNLLGANEATMTITYLALFARQNPAYILTAPILSYKTRAVSKPAAWIDAQHTRPALPDMDRFWDISQDSYHAPKPKNSASHALISDQLDQLYDGYSEDLEEEFSTQTDADRLGFIPEPLAIYQPDDEQESHPQTT
jgi:hypothetical protein